MILAALCVHQPRCRHDHSFASHRRLHRRRRVHILQDKDIPYYATIFRIHGPFLFGATDKISIVTENITRLPPVVVLRLRNMTRLDATGLFALEEVAADFTGEWPGLNFCAERVSSLYS